MTTKAKDTEVAKVEPEAKPPAPGLTPPPARRTAEEVATARGWLPPFIEGPGGRQTKNPNWWKYAAAFGHRPLGQEVTEKEFDAAVDAAINATHG